MISDRTLIQGQENRFNSKDKKLVSSRNWPEIFNKKVDIKKVDKVNLDITECNPTVDREEDFRVYRNGRRGIIKIKRYFLTF